MGVIEWAMKKEENIRRAEEFVEGSIADHFDYINVIKEAGLGE